MGQILTFKCKKCGYEANLWLGAGMTYNVLDNVISLFDEKTREKIKDAIKATPGSFWYVRKEIGLCDKCGKMSAIAVFELTKQDGVIIQYKAKCPCGAEVEILDSDKALRGEITISCPACGKLLEVTCTGHWD